VSPLKNEKYLVTLCVEGTIRELVPFRGGGERYPPIRINWPHLISILFFFCLCFLCLVFFFFFFFFFCFFFFFFFFFFFCVFFFFFFVLVFFRTWSPFSPLIIRSWLSSSRMRFLNHLVIPLGVNQSDSWGLPMIIWNSFFF